MKKELIIMVFKIDVEGLTRQEAEQHTSHLIKLYNFDDEELKNNYIIKQIWLPIRGESDVKIIYPDIRFDDKLIKEIEDAISEHPDSPITERLTEILNENRTEKRQF